MRRPAYTRNLQTDSRCDCDAPAAAECQLAPHMRTCKSASFLFVCSLGRRSSAAQPASWIQRIRKSNISTKLKPRRLPREPALQHHKLLGAAGSPPTPQKSALLATARSSFPKRQGRVKTQAGNAPSKRPPTRSALIGKASLRGGVKARSALDRLARRRHGQTPPRPPPTARASRPAATAGAGCRQAHVGMPQAPRHRV